MALNRINELLNKDENKAILEQIFEEIKKCFDNIFQKWHYVSQIVENNLLTESYTKDQVIKKNQIKVNYNKKDELNYQEAILDVHEK